MTYAQHHMDVVILMGRGEWFADLDAYVSVTHRCLATKIIVFFVFSTVESNIKYSLYTSEGRQFWSILGHTTG